MIDMGKIDGWGTGARRGGGIPVGGETPYMQPYGGGAVTTIPGTAGGYVNSGGTAGWNGYGTPAPNTGGGQMPASGNTGTGSNGSGFLYPDEWGQVGDYWSNILKGSGQTAGGGGGGGNANRFEIATPGAWTTGLDSLNQMAGNGQPVSSDAWWAATQGVTNNTIEDAIKNAAEQAGLGGTRWSTPLGYTAQDISGKYMGAASQQWADREMAAQEAAKQRMLEATGQLYQYGQGQYQMESDEMARRAQARAAAQAAGARNTAQMNMAAQALMGLGGQKAGLGLDVISKLFGMGTGMQDSQQQAINSSYNNPYMNYANQYIAGQNPTPQTYQPGFGSQLGGALNNGMMAYGMAGGWGNGGGGWTGANLGQMPTGGGFSGVMNQIPGLM